MRKIKYKKKHIGISSYKIDSFWMVSSQFPSMNELYPIGHFVMTYKLFIKWQNNVEEKKLKLDYGTIILGWTIMNK